DARSPEARVLRGAGDLVTELRRELAMNGRRVDAHFLEDPPAHEAHDPAATVAARVVRPLPRLAREAPGRLVGERRACRQVVLDLLESRTNLVPELLEPCARGKLAVV